jgi:tRNA-dihydrouridine synthase B
LKLAVEHKGERRGTVEFRKHYAGYLKGLHNAAKFRADLMQFLEVEPVLARLVQYRDEYPSEVAA